MRREDAARDRCYSLGTRRGLRTQVFAEKKVKITTEHAVEGVIDLPRFVWLGAESYKHRFTCSPPWRASTCWAAACSSLYFTPNVDIDRQFHEGNSKSVANWSVSCQVCRSAGWPTTIQRTHPSILRPWRRNGLQASDPRTGVQAFALSRKRITRASCLAAGVLVPGSPPHFGSPTGGARTPSVDGSRIRRQVQCVPVLNLPTRPPPPSKVSHMLDTFDMTLSPSWTKFYTACVINAMYRKTRKGLPRLCSIASR